MIKAADMKRLDTELGQVFVDSEIWLEENEIDFSAIEILIDSAFLVMAAKRTTGMKTEQILFETVANAFVLGWEAFRQYGPRAV